jgi:hypothetical protein
MKVLQPLAAEREAARDANDLGKLSHFRSDHERTESVCVTMHCTLLLRAFAAVDCAQILCCVRCVLAA